MIDATFLFAALLNGTNGVNYCTQSEVIRAHYSRFFFFQQAHFLSIIRILKRTSLSVKRTAAKRWNSSILAVLLLDWVDRLNKICREKTCWAQILKWHPDIGYQKNGCKVKVFDGLPPSEAFLLSIAKGWWSHKELPLYDLKRNPSGSVECAGYHRTLKSYQSHLLIKKLKTFV